MREMFPMLLEICHLRAHLLHMPIPQCNLNPFNFYLPFHTSPPVDQCHICAPSNCTMGFNTCARHLLFVRTDPYYTVIFYSCRNTCPPLLCNYTVLPVPLSTGPYLDYMMPGNRKKLYKKYLGCDTTKV